MLANHWRLHDALAVDHRAKSARPGGIDQGIRHGAAIERRIVAVLEHAIIGDDDAYRRVELPEAAHHPVLAPVLVLARDPHGGEQLLRDADLPVAVRTGKGLTGAKFARVRHTRQVALGIAGANPVQRLAGNDIEIPRLGIHRRTRAHREADDFLDQSFWHRIGLVAADASAAEDDVIEQHWPGIPSHKVAPLSWVLRRI